MSQQVKHSIILVAIVWCMVAWYYGIPMAYDWYLTRSQVSAVDALIATGQAGSGSVVDSGTVSIHDTNTTEYKSFIEAEQPKLTKQTRALLDQYNNDQDPKYLFDLVRTLTDDGAYRTAIYLYQILLKTYPETATYDEYLKLLLNRWDYDAQFLTEYQHTINTLSSSGLITKQDQLFFTAFNTLISGDVDTFYQTVYQLTGDYAPIASDLLANFDTYSAYKQAPQQYLRWLFASTLLRYGYYAPAIHLAQQSLKFNPDYVLWHQIMAYANLMTHDRDTAKSYLTKLMESDSTHLITYQRLYGVASYRDQEPKDAVRYLTQVNDKVPSIEMLRYLGLSYRSLYDYLHVTKTYRSILTIYQPELVDYFEFFDTYRRAVPYQLNTTMSGVVNPLDQYDDILLSDYITRCTQTMTGGQSYVCDYGRALQELFVWDTDKSMKIMILVARDYPYDFVFGMLGDLYLINGQSPTAEIYYQKAIKASYNGWYQLYLSNKIKELPINGS